MNKFVYILFISAFISTIGFSQTNILSTEAEQLKNSGLQNINDLDSSIVVHLLYAHSENFMGAPIYRNLREAYMQKEAALKLVEAQKYLKQANPLYKLIVYDAARPRWAQKIMWEKVKNTPMKNYVSSPAKISMHSYGVAVDISILDENNKELDMGTVVDFLGPLASPKHETKYFTEGKLTQNQINNRKLLRTIMKKAGFRGISNEWWHFEAFTRDEAQNKYSPIN